MNILFTWLNDGKSLSSSIPLQFLQRVFLGCFTGAKSIISGSGEGDLDADVDLGSEGEFDLDAEVDLSSEGEFDLAGDLFLTGDLEGDLDFDREVRETDREFTALEGVPLEVEGSGSSSDTNKIEESDMLSLRSDVKN